MTRQPATRLQVSGHRFLMRRAEHALVRGDPRMLDDPLRAQSISMLVGAVLTAVAVVVCVALAVVHPSAELGEEPVVVERETGAMFVRIGQRLHPVDNLASARLIIGTAVEPRIVSRQALRYADRGPAVGIPGAPHQIPTHAATGRPQWTVCDEIGSSTTVLAGAIDDGVVAGDTQMLVTPRGDSAAITYLIYRGVRARVDLRNPAVLRALQIEAVTPQPVSPILLAAIPEAPAITPPAIPDTGSTGPAGLPVGTVVQVPTGSLDGTAGLFVVLAGGIQRIGKVAADLIRFTDPRAGGQIPTVSADRIGKLPAVNTLPVITFPDRAGVTADPVVCAHWDLTAHPHTAVLTGAEVPAMHTPVALAQADGDGPALDAVVIPSGSGLFVRPVALSGDGVPTGSLFLVTDTGVRFGLVDSAAAESLGLIDAPAPAPWPMLGVLPGGPPLSREAASVARDGVGASP